MDRAIPGGLVTGYEHLIEGLDLPDPDDRHVLAAAICCGASVIVTFNQSDFPATTLTPLGIEAQHPDTFVGGLLDLDPAIVVTAARKQRANLVNPPMDADRFLNMLYRQGLVQTAKALMQFQAIL
jgi:hypothetical protein